jgi:hypothetical protein
MKAHFLIIIVPQNIVESNRLLFSPYDRHCPQVVGQVVSGADAVHKLQQQLRQLLLCSFSVINCTNLVQFPSSFNISQ